MKPRIDWLEKYMTEAEQMITGEEELNKGVQILESLLYEEPGYGRLHNHLGWAHLYYTQQLDQAELHFKAAQVFDPNFQAPYLHLGSLYIKQARYAEAIEVLKIGINCPMANRAEMFDLMARAFESMNDFRSAIEAYQEAMLAAVDNSYIQNLSEGVKRCRKKRWIKLFKGKKLNV